MNFSVSFRILAVCLVLLIWAAGCTREAPSDKTGRIAIEKIPPGEAPEFLDDLDPQSLRAAIKNSLLFYSRVPADRTFKLGSQAFTAKVMKESLLLFLSLLETDRLDRKSITEQFDIYGIRLKTKTHQILLTGYYEPILEGNLEKDEEYRYPLYRIPPDLLTIELYAFDRDAYAGKRLKGRLDGKRVVPYFSRSEIDGEDKLGNCGCQLVWLKDPIDVFFLHVQGSGMIRLPDGRRVRVGYAGSNGRPYRSIGKYLIEKGAISRKEMSLQAIRDYLKAHPEMQDEVLYYNESYVFFRVVDSGPVGSLNVPLTPGRSIASDPRYYPRGGIAFLESQKPIFGASGDNTGWEPMSRWVLNQDAGGAIKGPKRIDLFCGSGKKAEDVAGRLKHPARLYFFIKKHEKFVTPRLLTLDDEDGLAKVKHEESPYPGC